MQIRIEVAKLETRAIRARLGQSVHLTYNTSDPILTATTTSPLRTALLDNCYLSFTFVSPFQL